MNFLLPLIIWLGAGIPAAVPYFRRGRWDLGLAVVPFAGALALAGPWIFSALTGVSTAGWWWILEAAAISCVIGGLIELLDRVLPFNARTDAQPAGSAPLARSGGTSIPAVVAAGAVMIILSIVNFNLGITFSTGVPPYEWDAMAQWLPTAKILSDSPQFPRQFFVPGDQWEYPLLMSSLLACFRRFGHLEIHQLCFATGAVAAVLPLATWMGSWRRLGAAWAMLVAAAPLAVGNFAFNQYSCYADSMLAMSALAGLVLAGIGVRNRDALSLLAGSVALAACAATKNEGVVWVLSCGLMLGLYCLALRRGWKQAICVPAATAVIPIIFFFSWWGVCRQLHLQNDILAAGSLSSLADRVGVVLPGIGRQLALGQWRHGDGVDYSSETFWRQSDMLLWLPAIVLMPFLAKGTFARRAAACLSLLSAPLIYTAAMTMVYLLTPKPYVWHMDTSLWRVLFIVPAAVVAGAALVREPAAGQPEDLKAK